MVHFSTVLLCKLTSFKSPLCFRFPYQFFYAFLMYFVSATCPIHLILFNLIALIIWTQLQFYKQLNTTTSEVMLNALFIPNCLTSAVDTSLLSNRIKQQQSVTHSGLALHVAHVCRPPEHRSPAFESRSACGRTDVVFVHFAQLRQGPLR
jgi:hypothetical protein